MICTEMYPLHFFCGNLSVETYRLTDKLSILSQLFRFFRNLVEAQVAEDHFSFEQVKRCSPKHYSLYRF